MGDIELEKRLKLYQQWSRSKKIILYLFSEVEVISPIEFLRKGNEETGKEVLTDSTTFLFYISSHRNYFL